jgi:hypothetical protein
LQEAVYGAVKYTYVKRQWWLVAEYFQGQARFRHLFETVWREGVLHTIQDPVNRHWATARTDKAT